MTRDIPFRNRVKVAFGQAGNTKQALVLALFVLLHETVFKGFNNI